MQATPLFLGACALVSIAGVVSGASINTNPIQRAGIGMEEVPRPYLSFDPSDNGLSDQVALPDHYALNTPQGEIGVGELAMRGLYAQRRFAWRDAQWTPPPVPDFAEPQADPGWTASSSELTPEVPAAQSEASEPAPAAPPADVGQARIIDVESELTSQPS